MAEDRDDVRRRHAQLEAQIAELRAQLAALERRRAHVDVAHQDGVTDTARLSEPGWPIGCGRGGGADDQPRARGPRRLSPDRPAGPGRRRRPAGGAGRRAAACSTLRRLHPAEARGVVRSGSRRAIGRCDRRPAARARTLEGGCGGPDRTIPGMVFSSPMRVVAIANQKADQARRRPRRSRGRPRYRRQRVL